MTLIGLELNSSRARAVHGSRQHAGVPLPLEGEYLDLPLTISLEGRQPVVGWAGASVCRRLPHLVCQDFLPHLGGPKTWTAGRHRLDADRALGLVFDFLQRPFGKCQGILLALPAYLTETHRAVITRLAQKARWPLLGSVAAPVAAALAGHEQLPWTGLALVVDVDSHALTWSAVEVGDEARLLQLQSAPALGFNLWMRRLLDGAAFRCVRLSRRDPRESADTEQDLYDQLVHALEAEPGAVIELAIRTPQWYQHLMLQPGELATFCAPLVAQALAEMKGFLAAAAAHGTVGAVLLTPSAARLPGLASALEETLQAPGAGVSPLHESDFGEGLIEERVTAGRAHVLGEDVVARVAHDLAFRVHAGDLPRGHLEAAPLSAAAPPADAGPARLHFRGQDHFLSSPLFLMGRDPACDLVFETELFPSVSGRHCEIIFDRRVYTLRDRSRHGTFVNDRPVNQQVVLRSGDWIQLGPEGPVLRFLGQAPGQNKLLPTA